MSEVSASLVKQLREDTSAGMMDCKRALQESGGEMADAKAWLRKKGLAGAQAKSSRATEQGLVALAVKEKKQAVLIELNAETDFVARNESFQKFLRKVAKRALENVATSAEDLLELPMNAETATNGDGDNENLDNIDKALQALISTIGENMRLRRCAHLAVEKGLVASYMHTRIEGEDEEVPMGKIGVLVALEGDADDGILGKLGKSLALHIAAANPSVIAKEDLSDEVIAQEKEILEEQARANSPENAPIEKIVAGRMGKFFTSVVLQEQKYALDETKSIKSMLEEASKLAGSAIRIKGFHRFSLGEKINGD